MRFQWNPGHMMASRSFASYFQKTRTLSWVSLGWSTAFAMWGDLQTSVEFPTGQTCLKNWDQGNTNHPHGLKAACRNLPNKCKVFPDNDCRPTVYQAYSKTTVCKGIFISSSFETHIHNKQNNPQRKPIWYKCIFIFLKRFRLHKTAFLNFHDKKNTYMTSWSS